MAGPHQSAACSLGPHFSATAALAEVSPPARLLLPLPPSLSLPPLAFSSSPHFSFSPFPLPPSLPLFHSPVQISQGQSFIGLLRPHHACISRPFVPGKVIGHCQPLDCPACIRGSHESGWLRLKGGSRIEHGHLCRRSPLGHLCSQGWGRRGSHPRGVPGEAAP